MGVILKRNTIKVYDSEGQPTAIDLLQGDSERFVSVQSDISEMKEDIAGVRDESLPKCFSTDKAFTFLTSSSNFNAVTEPICTVNLWAGSDGIGVPPIKGVGFLHTVIDTNKQYRLQRVEFSNGLVFTRVYGYDSTGTWGDWNQLMRKSDFADIGTETSKSDTSFNITAKTLYKTCTVTLTKGLYIIEGGIEVTHSSAHTVRLGFGSESLTSFPAWTLGYITAYNATTNTTALKIASMARITNDSAKYCLFLDSDSAGKAYPSIKCTRIANIY